MTVTKRPRFLLDIEECAEYLFVEAGEDVARRWKDALDHAVALIVENPEIGRLRHDLPVPGIRSFFLSEFPRYLVFYRVGGQKIDLLRVRHGMMHLPGLF